MLSLGVYLFKLNIDSMFKCLLSCAALSTSDVFLFFKALVTLFSLITHQGLHANVEDKNVLKQAQILNASTHTCIHTHTNKMLLSDQPGNLNTTQLNSNLSTVYSDSAHETDHM